MIVIPAVDVRGGRAVRLVRGRPEEETVYADDPAEATARFEAEGAECIHLVDLDAALGTGENREAIRRAVERTAISIQVGGGLRSLEAVEGVLETGAARAVLGTEAVTDPGFLRACLSRWGERIVVAADVQGNRVQVRGWTEDAGALEEVLARLDAAGAPRYLVTAVARDGTLEGPDLDLYPRVRKLTDRPVIASGGVGALEHIRALAGAGVEGVVVGRALYEGAFTLREAVEATS